MRTPRIDDGGRFFRNFVWAVKDDEDDEAESQVKLIENLSEQCRRNAK